MPPPPAAAAPNAIDLAELKGRKIGRVLTKLGQGDGEQVHEALGIQKTRKQLLGKILNELGILQHPRHSGGPRRPGRMAFVDLAKFEPSDEVKAALSTETCQAYQVVAIDFNPRAKKIRIAMKSPDNFRAVDDIRLLMGFNVEAVVADAGEIDAILKKHYSKTESMSDVMSDLATDEKLQAGPGPRVTSRSTWTP